MQPAYFYGVVIDGIDAVETETNADEDEHGPSAPSGLRMPSGRAVGHVGRRIDVGLEDGRIGGDGDSEAGFGEATNEPPVGGRVRWVRLRFLEVEHVLYGTGCSTRTEPLADIFSEFLSCESHAMDAERGQRRGGIEEPSEDLDVQCVVDGVYRMGRATPICGG